MNNDKLLEELDRRAKARHEYLLSDSRIGIANLERTLCEKFNKRIESLEHSRVWGAGLLAGILMLWKKQI